MSLSPRLILCAALAACLARPVRSEVAAPPAPPAPLSAYVGTFLDSTAVRALWYPRTLRATQFKIDRERDRIYMMAGAGIFGAYRLSTFRSRVGSPLSTGAHGELYLPFEMSVSPEASGSGWATPEYDSYERLRDFDFDHRGYIYLAYSVWGFGIVDGRGNLIKQVGADSMDLSPQVALTFASQDQQYLVVSDGTSKSKIWNVTDPANAQFVRLLWFGISKYAKNAAEDAIAIVRPDATALQIYTPAALLTDGTPITVARNSTVSTDMRFRLVTTDGVKFYAEQEGWQGYNQYAIVSTIEPVSTGYASTEMAPLMNRSMNDLRFESGYLAYIGTDSSSGLRIGGLYRFDGADFVKFTIDSYLQSSYPYAGVSPQTIVPFCTDSGAYALFALHSVAQAFTLSPATWACLPGAPRDVSATAGNGTASVSFSPPASDGGSPIASYTVTSDPGAITATGSSPVSVGGLTNGVTYTFTVTATNSIGVGPQSAPSNPATPAASLLAPAQIQAAATSTTSAQISWSAAAHADHYEVLRSSMGAPFAVIVTNTGFTYRDSSLQPNTTYLYKVRSVASDGATSAPSAVDVATTVTFTSDPLTPGMTAASVYIEELRTAVNAMRAAGSLVPATFTDSTITAGTVIKAAHLTELRSALDDALTAIGVSRPAYTDATITSGVTPLKATHLQELRNNVK